MSVAEILDTARGLDITKFEHLFSELSAIRIQKSKLPMLNGVESQLLTKINYLFDEKKWERLKYLDWKSEFEVLSKKEESELLKLAESYENYSVEKLKCIAQLAEIRQISIDKLMENLGITHKIYA